MARMIRKQVYLEPDRDALLKRQARELGVTESDLIRRGIEQLARGSVTARDEQAWRDELAFIRERAARPELPEGRSWTRDELYADRIDRFSD
jgi:hypothetical protein